MEKIPPEIVEILRRMEADITLLRRTIVSLSRVEHHQSSTKRPPRSIALEGQPVVTEVVQTAEGARASKLSLSAEGRLLRAIKQLDSTRPLIMHRTLVAALAGYAPTSTKFEALLVSLARAGLISESTSTVSLTSVGRDQSTPLSEPLTSGLLADKVAIQLPRDQNSVFRVLFDSKGKPVKKTEIAQRCNLRNGTLLSQTLSRLERLGLASRVGRDSYACSEMLYVGEE